AKLPSPSIQLAWMNPSLASHRGDAGTRLQRCRYEPLLLLGAPAAATLHRGNDFNRGLAHVTIPRNSHMTHILRRRTRRPLPDGYLVILCSFFLPPRRGGTERGGACPNEFW